MGLFDIFTGAPARRAAAENTARLGQLRTDGLGYLDTGLQNATGALDTARMPFSALGDKYGAATTLGLDAYGVNGIEAGQNAWNAFQNANPQTQGAIDAGLDAINRRRAGAGMLNSGNADLDALNFAQNTQNQQFNNWRNGLTGFSGIESGAASGLANLGSQQAGLYTNDANQRVNLGTNVTNGINSQATQAANAQMQGSGNLLGLGMNLLTLGAGGMGGGGGLFGSFGGGPSMNSNPGNGAGGYTYPVYR